VSDLYTASIGPTILLQQNRKTDPRNIQYTVKKFDEVVRQMHLVTQDQFSLVSKKYSGIHEDNCNKNIEFFQQTSQMSNFFAINTFPTSNFLDDDHRTYQKFLQMSNFFDKNGMLKIDATGARTFVLRLTIPCFTTAPHFPCILYVSS
jgi:hypothetical protein